LSARHLYVIQLVVSSVNIVLMDPSKSSVPNSIGKVPDSYRGLLYVCDMWVIVLQQRHHPRTPFCEDQVRRGVTVSRSKIWVLSSLIAKLHKRTRKP
jgi:hypothetical protein